MPKMILYFIRTHTYSRSKPKRGSSSVPPLRFLGGVQVGKDIFRGGPGASLNFRGVTGGVQRGDRPNLGGVHQFCQNYPFSLKWPKLSQKLKIGSKNHLLGLARNFSGYGYGPLRGGPSCPPPEIFLEGVQKKINLRRGPRSLKLL